MKMQLPGYKSSNPAASHQEAFKAVAGMWKTAPENPRAAKEGGFFS